MYWINSNNLQKQNFEETFKDCAPACNRSDQKLIERFDMAKTNVLLNGWKIILDKKKLKYQDAIKGFKDSRKSKLRTL